MTQLLSEERKICYCKCCEIFFRSITVPEQRKGTTTAKQFVGVIIVYLVCLLLAFSLVLPMVLQMPLAYFRSTAYYLQCIAYFCYGWLVPLVYVTAMVFAIFMKLRRGTSGRVIAGDEIEDMEREHMATERSMIIIMMIAIQFFVLTLPHQLMTIVSPPWPREVSSWFECLSYVNGCMKPIIFALMFRSINNETSRRDEASRRDEKSRTNASEGFEPLIRKHTY